MADRQKLRLSQVSFALRHLSTHGEKKYWWQYFGVDICD